MKRRYLSSLLLFVWTIVVVTIILHDILVSIHVVSALKRKCTFDTMEQVDVTLQWIVQSQFAGFIAANSLGYYDQECLQVTIRPGGPRLDSLSSIKSGTGHFAVIWFNSMLAARENGIKVQTIWQHFSRSGIRGLTRKESGIDSFQKLKGRKIGYWPGSLLYDVLLESLRRNNLNETDVILVPQDFTSLVLVDRPDQYDFVEVMLYSEYAQVLLHKKPGSKSLWSPDDFHLLDPNDMKTQIYEDSVVVNENWLYSNYTKNRETTIKFLKASLKGWIYCRDNEAACLSMLPEKTPLQQWQIRETNRLVWPTNPNGLGIPNRTIAEETIKIAHEYGLISSLKTAENSFTDIYAQAAIDALEKEINAASTPKHRSMFWDIVGSRWSKSRLKFCYDTATEKPFICTRKKISVALGLAVAGITILFLVIFIGVVGLGIFWRRQVLSRRRLNYFAPTKDECVVAFTDVQSSTAMWAKDPDTMKVALEQHNELLRRLLREYQGFECKTHGDSFMVAFKDPLLALKWMLQTQLDLLQVNWSKKLLNFKDAGFEVSNITGELLFRGLRIRMGGHYGKPDIQLDSVTKRYDYYGNDVNIASRIASAAHGGQILISEQLYHVVQDRLQEVQPDGYPVTITRLGKYVLRGIEGECELIQVLPLSLSGRRFPPPKTDTITQMKGSSTITPALVPPSNPECSTPPTSSTTPSNNISTMHSIMMQLRRNSAPARSSSLRLRDHPYQQLEKVKTQIEL